jgi:hypothetical protein
VFVVVSLGCFGLGRDIVSGYFRLGVLVSGGSCLFGIFVLVCYFRLGVSVVTCISRCFCCRITLYCRYCTVRLCCHLTLLVSLCCHSHYSLCLSLSLSLSHTLCLSLTLSLYLLVHLLLLLRLLSLKVSAATTQITLSESLFSHSIASLSQRLSFPRFMFQIFSFFFQFISKRLESIHIHIYSRDLPSFR